MYEFMQAASSSEGTSDATATVVLGIVGIVGTLLAALAGLVSAPILARKSFHREQRRSIYQEFVDESQSLINALSTARLLLDNDADEETAYESAFKHHAELWKISNRISMIGSSRVDAAIQVFLAFATQATYSQGLRDQTVEATQKELEAFKLKCLKYIRKDMGTREFNESRKRRNTRLEVFESGFRYVPFKEQEEKQEGAQDR